MQNRELILELLSKIEQEKDVKIIFAIESGSRLWGMASEDSDFDVRFIYVHPLNHYLTVFDLKNDTIDQMIDKNMDMVGWDIRKYLRLLAKSNPTAMEWLASDQIYMGEERKELFREFLNYINPIALFEHYVSMAKSNWTRYIEPYDQVVIKKYLYVLRALINSLYVLEKQQQPFSNIEKTLEYVSISENVKNGFLELIKQKRKGFEVKEGGRIKELDVFIKQFMDSLEEKRLQIMKLKLEKLDKIRYDEIFQNILNKLYS